MAVGKEAPIPGVVVRALASRKSLEVAVAELKTAFSETSIATIKRRFKKTEAHLSFANYAVAAAAGDEGLDKK